MKKFFAIISFFALIFVFGCSQPFDIKERSSAIKELMTQGKEVAKFSPSPEVPEALDFMSSSMYLAKPLYGENENEISSEALEDGPEVNFPIRIIPLKKRDGSIGIVWKKIYDSNLLAFVGPSRTPIIFVVKIDLKITDFFKGLFIIHESLHVVDIATQRFFIGDDDRILQRNLSEYHVYYRCNEILRQAGGKAYVEAVEQEVDRLEKNQDKQFCDLSKDFMKTADEIFGKSLSKEEEGLRKTQLTMDVIFSFYDKIMKDKKEREEWKLAYVSRFHSDMTKF